MAVQEGKPIWVESLMNEAELREAHKLYPTTVRSGKHVQYDPSYHEGGTWRKGMGASLSAEEIELINSRMDAVLKRAGIVRQNQSNGTQ